MSLGVALVLSATLITLSLLGLISRRRRPPRPLKPVCPCGHSVAYHEGAVGPCHEQIQRESRWNTAGGATGYRWAACCCQVYAGPELVSSLTMQPLASRPLAEWTDDTQA